MKFDKKVKPKITDDGRVRWSNPSGQHIEAYLGNGRLWIMGGEGSLVVHPKSANLLAVELLGWEEILDKG